MVDLDPEKLHVRLTDDVPVGSLTVPRRYTLTHSDRTADRFLTIGTEYDRKQISGAYTRFMRDEVLAEWVDEGNGPELIIHLHVSGGLVFGHAALRYKIFKSCMRSVIQALRLGDEPLYKADPSLELRPVKIRFHSRSRRFDIIEDGGAIGDCLKP